MGMFDSVMVPCPHCGQKVEFQSKAWDCEMAVWALAEAPATVVMDVMNAPAHCPHCDGWFALVDPRYPPGWHPSPAPVAAPVTPPDNPDTHWQGMKWWPAGRPFTYGDLTPAGRLAITPPQSDPGDECSCKEHGDAD